MNRLRNDFETILNSPHPTSDQLGSSYSLDPNTIQGKVEQMEGVGKNLYFKNERKVTLTGMVYFAEIDCVMKC